MMHCRFPAGFPDIERDATDGYLKIFLDLLFNGPAAVPRAWANPP
jgi:hypothetical protein